MRGLGAGRWHDRSQREGEHCEARGYPDASPTRGVAGPSPPVVKARPYHAWFSGERDSTQVSAGMIGQVFTAAALGRRRGVWTGEQQGPAFRLDVDPEVAVGVRSIWMSQTLSSSGTGMIGTLRSHRFANGCACFCFLRERVSRTQSVLDEPRRALGGWTAEQLMH